MKRLCNYFLIVISLAACARHSSGGFRCSPDGQVCVTIHANEPIHYGDPVVVVISVTSERDIDNLYIDLAYNVDLVIEGIENWNENIEDPLIWPAGAVWRTAINADQTLNFTRTFYLPPNEGYFSIIASITEKDSFRTSNELTIAITHQGGTVYLANTPIPQTPGLPLDSSPEEIATLLAMPTYTPWPTITAHPVEATNTPAAYP